MLANNTGRITGYGLISFRLIAFAAEYGRAGGSLTAAAMIKFIPTLHFGFFAQRYLTEGLAIGEVKD